MSALFSPYALGPLALRNRIAIAPMCQYSATDGNASDWHMMHLVQLATSGAGLLVIEATAVEDMGRITASDLGLYSDANQAALAPVLAAIRRYSGIKVAVQLAHAGRKASSQVPWQADSKLRRARQAVGTPWRPPRCRMAPRSLHRWRWTTLAWPA